MKVQVNWLLLVVGLSSRVFFYALTMFPQDCIFSEYKKAFKEVPRSPGTKFIPMDQSGFIDPDGMSQDEVASWGPLGFRLLENLKDDQHFWNIEPLASYYYVGIGGFSPSHSDIRCLF